MTLLCQSFSREMPNEEVEIQAAVIRPRGREKDKKTNLIIIRMIEFQKHILDFSIARGRMKKAGSRKKQEEWKGQEKARKAVKGTLILHPLLLINSFAFRQKPISI